MNGNYSIFTGGAGLGLLTFAGEIVVFYLAPVIKGIIKPELSGKERKALLR